MTSDTDRYRANYTDEVNAAFLYRVAAELEDDGPILGCGWLARQQQGRSC